MTWWWHRTVLCRLGRHWTKWDGGRMRCVYCGRKGGTS